MLDFLLKRPIGVLMTFFAAFVFSILAFTKLPVSLLPNIEVPQIVITVSYPNASPEEIETNVLRPMRQSMATLNAIKSVESEAISEAGKIQLFFEHETAMDLAYIAVNEKIHRLSNVLPSNIERPQVNRINTSDIPLVHIQVVPKSEEDILSISKLVDRVVKKRLESLEGVSLIDINGLQRDAIYLIPDDDKLRALGIELNQFLDAVRQQNVQMGALTIKDGNYRYFLKIKREALNSVEAVGNIPIRNPEGRIFRLSEMARVERRQDNVRSYHFFNNKQALLINVHKQDQAQMNKLVPLIHSSVDELNQEFDNISFKIIRDQSELLDASINNLTTSLLFGGFFAFVVLFVFMANFRIPLIIGITLPASVLLSFSLLYLFDISLNIISISGIALGLGMLIDNSIIVSDNISRNLSVSKVADGESLLRACLNGTNEVITPLISSVLTTLSVFVPLVFLNGLTGSLFYDQAIAVSAILGFLHY